MSARAHSLDTNVIVRFLTKDNDILHPKAERIMQAVTEGRLTVVCDPVILAEVAWVLNSYYKLPRADICNLLMAIVKSDNVLIPNKSRYALALEIFGKGKAHYADACACAAALEACEGRLFSFDRELSEVEGIDRREMVDG